MPEMHAKERITIINADDHDVLRESWAFFLEKDERFTVVSKCRNGREAIEKTKSLLPYIIPMDINLGILNAFEAIQIIIGLMPSAKIIGVSVNNHPDYAAIMLDLGAKGIVTKTLPLVNWYTQL